MNYTYQVDTFYNGSWVKLFQAPMQYCLGYLDSKIDHSPRNDFRVVRSDGKVVSAIEQKLDVSIGQVAGWPTAEQYEQAAEKALAMAKVIRNKRERMEHPE